MATSEQHSGSKETTVILVNSLLLGLATIAIGIRLLTRGVYLKSFGIDDAFCLIGYIFTFALCVLCALMVRYGYGRHIETLTAHDLTMFLRIDFATEILYIFAFVTIKMSFLFLYLKLFPGRTMAWSSYALLVILVCQLIEETAVVIFQCSPVQKAWHPGMPGKCLELLPFFYISFGIKLVVDIVIITLPIPVLWRLKLPRGKKIGICLMFLLGLLICVTSIIRATYLTNTSSDISWILVDELNWSSVEVCVAVICACIPSFKVLLSFQFPVIYSLLGLSTSKAGTSNPTRHRSYGAHFSTKNDQHIRLEENIGTKSSSYFRTEVSGGLRGDSEEQIVKPEHGIAVTTDYVVTDGDAITGDSSQHSVSRERGYGM